MIIDGNALIHRSYHALPPLTTKTGELVNAVYGFTAVLFKAIREFKPTFVALTLDRKEKTFRHKEYRAYKATRIKAPDELYEQIPKVKQIAAVLNIPIFEKAGFEADDLIGTLVSQVDGSIEKIIVTGDLDTLQLVNQHTKVFTMKRGLTDSQIYDERVIKQRYGLAPKQMIDFKALRGDPSDNIPGVKGIGEKTATKLLQQFKTLEGVYKSITSKKIKDRVRELLKQYKDNAFMSRKLATIKCDAEIKFNLEKTRFGNFDQEKAAQVFSQFEFKSLLPRLQNIASTQKVKKTAEQVETEILDKFERNRKELNYQLIDNVPSASSGYKKISFENFLKKLKQQKEFAFDTETASFNAVTADLLGISFSWKAGQAYYLNFKSKNEKGKNNNLFNYKNKNEERRRLNPWLEKLRPIFENQKIKKFGHNIKYDFEVLASLGIKVRGLAADTMVASYLLNPGSRQHNLDGLTFSEFNHQKITKDDLLGKGREKIEFSQVALEKLYLYSCEDADFTYRLTKKLLPELKKQKLDKLFNQVEMPLVKVLATMEINGIKIEKKILNRLGDQTKQKVAKLEKLIYQQAGQKFNINSTQQLGEILFEKLELSTVGIAKTKTGLSTGSDELVKLKDQHPIIKLIQNYRELVKLSNTYLEALPELINPQTSRLHTSFNQSITATGRLSSTEPNLQNIPIRTDLGRQIRQAFLADSGFQLLSMDYSQIELRLAAHMSGDKKMIKAFKQGADIHLATAAEINQVSLEAVMPEMRREAKAINFGILYGQGPHGLSQNADIPYARAKEFIDQYFKAYQGVKKFIDQTIKLARQRGYAETLFGRRRYLPEINSSVIQVRKAAERMAINTPLQGTAADIIKIAMIRIKEMIDKKYQKEEVKMLLQVHDELVFEVKDDAVKKMAGEIKEIMESVIKLKVPLVVDASAGDSWGEMEEVRNIAPFN